MSDARAGASVGMWATGAACLFVLLVLALGADRAAASTATDRPLLFTFNGADTSAGAFDGADALDIDQASGIVYVIDEQRDVVDKFNLAGVAQSFSSTGRSSLSPRVDLNFYSSIAIDNSAANPGRIYVMPEFGPLKAIDSAGQLLWTLSEFNDVCGLAVDSAGHPWVGDYTNSLAREYATTGTPPSQIGSVSTAPNKLCRLGLDASGDLYANTYQGGVDKYVGGVKVSTLDAGSSNGVAVDQSSASGHIFTLHNGSFNEYDASGKLLGTYGAGTIGSGAGIAYDDATDRVYVSDRASNTVEVFGPMVTGTVPDVTIEPTSEVSVNKATFHGTVNPQGVPSSYYFEWKQGTGSSWGSAHSSPPVSLPVDSNDHSVSYTATDLGGGREYQVRLVGVNTENSLRAASSPDTFATPAGSTPPSASIDGISAITTTSAHVAATIDTSEDLTEWSVELSSDPACESGFQSSPTNIISGGHAAAVTVGEDFENLQSSEHYCVRIRATNSAGTTTSETKQFTTKDFVPTQVFTAFVAPRTDTTARLNGYVNPEGSETIYRFEYSEDGSGWTTLPDQQTRRSRAQILVGEELTGLAPSTTYHYRFSVENGAGLEEGEEKAFTTRSTEEMQLPQRGIELVNNPEKGTQNVLVPQIQGQPMPVAESGNKAIWSTTAGAPGSTTAAIGTFLATRTPTGWQSRSLAPPAAEQVGGGNDLYGIVDANPAFNRFLEKAYVEEVLLGPAPTFVRLDDEQHQEVLNEYTEDETNTDVYNHVDTTSDMSHVFLVNPANGQLEDVGSGTPETVSIMPDGTPNQCGLATGGRSFVGGGAGNESEWQPGYHRIATTDGSRVYFRAVPNGHPCSGFALEHEQATFYRDRNTEETVEVDEGGTMIRATPDGRSLYFWTKDSLAPDDTNSTGDVYRFEADTGEDVCVTCAVPNAAVLAGRFPILISDDFSHIYFDSKNQLVPGYGTQGETNLYSFSNGEVRFVTTLNHPEGSIFEELSANGNVLLFSPFPGGNLELTADHLATTCPSPEGNPAADCTELFRYEDSGGTLECLSCRNGGTTVRQVGGIGGSDFSFHISGDGSTAAFVTKEALLPQDINGTYDIYEWKHGALKLISDGETPYPSDNLKTGPKVAGVDGTGDNIFFTLVDPGLTGYETDKLENFYDSRVGGGFPRPQAPAHCSEESCQGPLQSPPTLKSSGSASLSGQGNQPPAHRAKKKRRCVRHRGRARSRCKSARKPKHQTRKHHRSQATAHNGGSK